MSWVDPILDRLAEAPAVGYSPAGKPAAEPTAIAALALLAHERNSAATAIADKLVQMQQENGEVAVRPGEEWPGWPTSLAISTWCAITHTDRAVGNALRGVPSGDAPNLEKTSLLHERISRAIEWLLANRGRGVERSGDFGHNTELVGWAYAEGTHSWVEPTAFAVLALTAAGRQYEAAAREGIAVLVDRQLPGGGLNYGNTFVLGQQLRPHIQPTGIGLLALAGEADATGRIAKSIAWLRRSIGPQTTPTSLAWATLGLKTHGVTLPETDQWLENAAEQVRNRDASPYKLALLALAAKGWPQ
ncbi:MAG TPA: hypothetical protein VGI40_03765 [Pirellulaceae bacterium]|jgi:hypothetical protein